jgi:hypothetical protein
LFLGSHFLKVMAVPKHTNDLKHPHDQGLLGKTLTIKQVLAIS